MFQTYEGKGQMYISSVYINVIKKKCVYQVCLLRLVILNINSFT